MSNVHLLRKSLNRPPGGVALALQEGECRVRRAPVGASDEARAGARRDALLGAVLDHLEAAAHAHALRLLAKTAPEVVVACARTELAALLLIYSHYWNVSIN